MSFTVRLEPGAEASGDLIEGTPGTGEWQDPQLLGQLAARAQRLTLQEGERASLPLRLVQR